MKKVGKYEGLVSVLLSRKFLGCAAFLCFAVYVGTLPRELGLGDGYKKEDFLNFSEKKDLIEHRHELWVRMGKIQELEEIIVFRPLCRQLIECRKHC